MRKKQFLLLLILFGFQVYCQENSINDILITLNNSTFKIDRNSKKPEDIASNIIDKKNYFLKTECDTIYFFNINKIEHFYVYLVITSDVLTNVRSILDKKYELDENFTTYSTGFPNELIIYDEIKRMFYFLPNYNSSTVSISKRDGIEIPMFFEISLPIILLDNNFKFKFCFFNTSLNTNNNLSHCEFIYNDNYFQVNYFAQKEIKDLKVLDVDIDLIQYTYKNETVLSRKEYYQLFQFCTLDIYREIFLKKLRSYQIKD